MNISLVPNSLLLFICHICSHYSPLRPNPVIYSESHTAQEHHKTASAAGVMVWGAGTHAGSRHRDDTAAEEHRDASQEKKEERFNDGRF